MTTLKILDTRGASYTDIREEVYSRNSSTTCKHSVRFLQLTVCSGKLGDLNTRNTHVLLHSVNEACG
jgi:hypothetical protein